MVMAMVVTLAEWGGRVCVCVVSRAGLSLYVYLVLIFKHLKIVHS